MKQAKVMVCRLKFSYHICTKYYPMNCLRMEYFISINIWWKEIVRNGRELFETKKVNWTKNINWNSDVGNHVLLHQWLKIKGIKIFIKIGVYNKRFYWGVEPAERMRRDYVINQVTSSPDCAKQSARVLFSRKRGDCRADFESALIGCSLSL